MKVNEIELENTLTTVFQVNLKNTYEEIPITKVSTNEKTTALKIYKKEKRIIKYINVFVKRLIDIVGAIVGIILLIPIIIIVAIANIVSGDFGPLFYSQSRIGKDGKLFKFYKFRSMVVNADEILEQYLSENEKAREEYKVNKKLQKDPRITRIGRFLRKTSIDEFPQFINVLKGEMSLVGPRPYLPKEKEDMGEYYDIVIKHNPGLTRTLASKWKVKCNI